MSTTTLLYTVIFYFDLKLDNYSSGNGIYYYQSPNLTTPVAYPGFYRGHPKNTYRNDPVEERGPNAVDGGGGLRVDLATAVRFKITWGRKTNKKKKNSVAGADVEYARSGIGIAIFRFETVPVGEAVKDGEGKRKLKFDGGKA
ncbi:hypothetical protein RHSIM_Rhsim06G0028800 [Rhododendron simsii]|uniref:Uncharacterized protein n=1 Tax=Rhododendron simsii TaxID=118357 RepID=A0A834LME6_RHOSS|nr:hypothetical protein RHSIM_Rhsim06G0028800 [Rhododendron simsii]